MFIRHDPFALAAAELLRLYDPLAPLYGNRRYWSCWFNAKQSAAYLDIPRCRFWWLVRKGWFSEPTIGPSDRRLWFPDDLRRSHARLPERFK